MGLLDAFKKKHENVGKDKKPTHTIAQDIKPEVKSSIPEKSKKENAKVEEKNEKKLKLVKPTRNAHRILKKFILTEKSSRLQKLNQYTFAVAPEATKISIREAVHAVYNVRPIGVQTRRVHGKRVRFGQLSGQQKTWKKTIVTLKAGDRIDTAE
jgi:large subunit ribosomal protein L23